MARNEVHGAETMKQGHFTTLLWTIDGHIDWSAGRNDFIMDMFFRLIKEGDCVSNWAGQHHVSGSIPPPDMRIVFHRDISTCT